MNNNFDVEVKNVDAEVEKSEKEDKVDVDAAAAVEEGHHNGKGEHHVDEENLYVEVDKMSTPR